jgi:outer membrane protein assembly factor BamB
MDGRLFTIGVDKICAVTPYNGRVLWEYAVPQLAKAYHQEHLMGVAGTNSRCCAADGSLYVAYGAKCIRIDAATGKKIAEFKAPPRPNGKPGEWGYIACQDGILFGTLVNDNYLVPYRFGKSNMQTQYTESLLFFALDAKTGKSKWAFTPKQSIRNNAITIGGGRVYLIDRGLAFEPSRRSKETRPHPTGELIAFDAKTGKPVWQSAKDIYGTVLELSVEHDALLMCYQPTRFRLASEAGGKWRVYKATTGERFWDLKAPHATRPLINDRTIYADPGAWDLLTGEMKMRPNPKTGETEPWKFNRSYGCGIVSGSRNLLLFRSATIGYVDLLQDGGTENYGGIRPGCWINTLAVGGLVVVPDTTNVCKCSYLNKASIALQPVRR